MQNIPQMLLDAEYEAIERWCKGRLPTIHQLHLFSNQLLTIFPWRYSEKTLSKTFSWIEADEMKFVDVSICLEFVSSFYQLYFAATFPLTFPQGFVSLYIFLHTHLCIILYISFCIFVHILFVFLYISFCIFVHILFVLWGNFPLNCSPRLCKSVHISAPASESDTRCKFYSSSPFVKDRNTSWSNFSINFIKYISRWNGSTFILGYCHCLYCFLEWRSVHDFLVFRISELLWSTLWWKYAGLCLLAMW